MSNFSTQVQHISQNAPVLSSIASQATRQLEGRTNELKEALDNIAAGKALIISDQALAPSVLEFSAVYWNAAENRFSMALADAVTDANGNTLPSPSCDCIGICVKKDTTESGSILCLGVTEATPTQLVNLIGSGTGVSGRYYLSSAIAGRVTAQSQPINAPVCYIFANGVDCQENVKILVAPQLRNFALDHVHIQHKLFNVPAGTHVPPNPGDIHEITDADASLPGWLPATSEFFEDIPDGAKFGYNLSQHLDLAAVWPPLPMDTAVLEGVWPFSVEVRNMLTRIPANMYRITRETLWWMSDCTGDVPWLPGLDTTEEPADPELCPLPVGPDMLISFLKMTFANDNAVVTSLKGDSNNVIVFKNRDGIVADRGELHAELDLAASVTNTAKLGSRVIKNVKPDVFEFESGYVVEGMKSNSPRLVLTGTESRLLNPTAEASEQNPLIQQGIVSFDLLSTGDAVELAPQYVRMSDALQRDYKSISYIGFPSGRPTSISVRFDVPDDVLAVVRNVVIKLTLFGRQAGPFSALTLRYFKVLKPSNVPQVLSDTTTAISLDVVTPSTGLAADSVILVTSGAISVMPGDTLFVTLSRAAGAIPAYNNEIGLIRIVAVAQG